MFSSKCNASCINEGKYRPIILFRSMFCWPVDLNCTLSFKFNTVLYLGNFTGMIYCLYNNIFPSKVHVIFRSSSILFLQIITYKRLFFLNIYCHNMNKHLYLVITCNKCNFLSVYTCKNSFKLEEKKVLCKYEMYMFIFYVTKSVMQILN